MVFRIMERLIKDSLVAYLLKHDLNNTGQIGFLCKKSRATILTDYLNYISKAVNTRSSVTIIILDVTNALDRVSPLVVT